MGDQSRPTQLPLHRYNTERNIETVCISSDDSPSTPTHPNVAIPLSWPSERGHGNSTNHAPTTPVVFDTISSSYGVFNTSSASLNTRVNVRRPITPTVFPDYDTQISLHQTLSETERLVTNAYAVVVQGAAPVFMDDSSGLPSRANLERSPYQDIPHPDVMSAEQYHLNEFHLHNNLVTQLTPNPNIWYPRPLRPSPYGRLLRKDFRHLDNIVSSRDMESRCEFCMDAWWVLPPSVDSEDDDGDDESGSIGGYETAPGIEYNDEYYDALEGIVREEPSEADYQRVITLADYEPPVEERAPYYRPVVTIADFLAETEEYEPVSDDDGRYPHIVTSESDSEIDTGTVLVIEAESVSDRDADDSDTEESGSDMDMQKFFKQHGIRKRGLRRQALPVDRRMRAARESDSDTEHWRCLECLSPNNRSFFRYCERCWKVRSDWMPDHARKRKKPRHRHSKKKQNKPTQRDRAQAGPSNYRTVVTSRTDLTTVASTNHVLRLNGSEGEDLSQDQSCASGADVVDGVDGFEKLADASCKTDLDTTLEADQVELNTSGMSDDTRSNILSLCQTVDEFARDYYDKETLENSPVGGSPEIVSSNITVPYLRSLSNNDCWPDSGTGSCCSSQELITSHFCDTCDVEKPCVCSVPDLKRKRNSLVAGEDHFGLPDSTNKKMRFDNFMNHLVPAADVLKKRLGNAHSESSRRRKHQDIQSYLSNVQALKTPLLNGDAYTGLDSEGVVLDSDGENRSHNKKKPKKKALRNLSRFLNKTAHTGEDNPVNILSKNIAKYLLSPEGKQHFLESGLASSWVKSRPVQDALLVAISNSDPLCITCNDAPKNAVIIHGKSSHIATCYPCAKKLFKTTKKCPVCCKRILRIAKNVIC